ERQRALPTYFLLQVPPISNITYDLRLPPSTLRPTLLQGYLNFDEPFSISSLRPRSIHLISKDFPWTVVIHESTRGAGVTCRDAVCGLYDALQVPLTDVDWGYVSESERRRERVLRAWKRRERLLKGATGLKRVDLLGRRCRLQGFRKDEDFVRRRVFPGTRRVVDTWVVCFVH
ncbi:hypothetical protein FB45DRAFT_781085, partial [Roridomyces roridus]